MSKNKIQNSDSLIDSLGIETEKLITNENEEIFSTTKFVSFPFNLELGKVEFLRNFVLFKRSLSPDYFHYNNSHAVREGILLLQNENPNLELIMEPELSIVAFKRIGWKTIDYQNWSAK